jgi:hypothetical protein
MSLSYSLWSNDSSGNSTKLDKSQKRQPTMTRTTLKKKQTLKPPISIKNIGELDEYVSASENFQDQFTATIENMDAENKNRENRVNELLNKITSVNVENEGDKLMNFKPISNPNYSVKKDNFIDSMQNVYDSNEIPFPQNELYNPPPKTEKTNHGYPSYHGEPHGSYSNYSTTYSNPNILYPYHSKSNRGGGVLNNVDANDTNLNRILEKLNYVVHMLEEQHDEKTNNITEEFILYTFLGVFVIFVVDSFSRTGKYVR